MGYFGVLNSAGLERGRDGRAVIAIGCKPILKGWLVRLRLSPWNEKGRFVKRYIEIGI